jgi:fluoride exporter
MRNLLLVGAGGFLGSVARYYATSWAAHLAPGSRFPLGTLAVNLTGCLLMGLLAGIAEQAQVMSAGTRLFLLTGLLGGFTTYSAFAWETYALGRDQLMTAALANVALQLVLGIGAVMVGAKLAASY